MNRDMRVAGVHKTLVSAGGVTGRGHVIMLSKFGHQTACRAPSSAPSFWLDNKNGACTLRVWFRNGRNSQWRQEQASARWQYQHHQRQIQQLGCKEQHCKDQRHLHRHQQVGMRWREPQVFHGNSCGCKTRRGRRRGGYGRGWRGRCRPQKGGKRGAAGNPLFFSLMLSALRAEQSASRPSIEERENLQEQRGLRSSVITW